MVDTTTIRIMYPNFTVMRPELFSPRAKFNSNSDIDAKATRKDVRKEFVQHRSSEDKTNGTYKPSVTIIQQMKKDSRELVWFVTIQVSLPKLLHGNSISELSVGDNETIYFRLERVLFMMGIKTTIEQIKTATVTKCHLGKNIILSNNYTVSQAIALISKTVASRQVKKRETHYENDGEAFHFYTTSHGRVFYNKLKDYLRGVNTALDKDRLEVERSLGTQLRCDGWQILRFETRFNGQTTVNSKLKHYLNVGNRLVQLHDIFDEKFWKKALLDEWRDIVGNPASQLPLKFETSQEEILRAFLKHACIGKDRNVYALNTLNDLYGTFCCIRDMGVEAYKNLIEQTFSEKTLGTRLDTKIKLIERVVREIPAHPIISDIDTQIKACRQVNLAELLDNEGKRH